ncbi:MAG: tetratricopeptide repeat protein [Calditrichaceae bacterium]
MSETSLSVKEVKNNEWQFVKSAYFTNAEDDLSEVKELLEDGETEAAEELLRAIISDYPEFLDAYHHLALLLSDNDEDDLAFDLWKKAADIALRCFPEEFDFTKNRIEWKYAGNRPFLKVYKGLGMEYFLRGNLEKAVVIFRNLLYLNPADDQDARSLAIQVNFALKQPEEVIGITELFPNDILIDTCYGRILGLYMTGDRRKASAALKEAIELFPAVAAELVKTDHRQSVRRVDQIFFSDSDEEAFDYWERAGHYWAETEGALEFLSAGIMKYTD